MKKGTLCRSSSEDECDLEEYCNGTSGECTPDLWVMDGHPCRRNTAFCYRGVCQTADKQCQEVFGRGEGAGQWEKGPAVLWEMQRPGREALKWETVAAPAQTRLRVPASAQVSPGVTKPGVQRVPKVVLPDPEVERGCRTDHEWCVLAGAKDGPFDCYEEINSQRDRMGHCGSSDSGYQRCEWK